MISLQSFSIELGRLLAMTQSTIQLQLTLCQTHYEKMGFLDRNKMPKCGGYQTRSGMSFWNNWRQNGVSSVLLSTDYPCRWTLFPKSEASSIWKNKFYNANQTSSSCNGGLLSWSLSDLEVQYEDAAQKVAYQSHVAWAQIRMALMMCTNRN